LIGTEEVPARISQNQACTLSLTRAAGALQADPPKRNFSQASRRRPTEKSLCLRLQWDTGTVSWNKTTITENMNGDISAQKTQYYAIDGAIIEGHTNADLFDRRSRHCGVALDS
jgi:hypothetical protein